MEMGTKEWRQRGKDVCARKGETEIPIQLDKPFLLEMDAPVQQPRQNL